MRPCRGVVELALATVVAIAVVDADGKPQPPTNALRGGLTQPLRRDQRLKPVAHARPLERDFRPLYIPARRPHVGAPLTEPNRVLSAAKPELNGVLEPPLSLIRSRGHEVRVTYTHRHVQTRRVPEEYHRGAEIIRPIDFGRICHHVRGQRDLGGGLNPLPKVAVDEEPAFRLGNRQSRRTLHRVRAAPEVLGLPVEDLEGAGGRIDLDPQGLVLECPRVAVTPNRRLGGDRRNEQHGKDGGHERTHDESLLGGKSLQAESIGRRSANALAAALHRVPARQGSRLRERARGPGPCSPLHASTAKVGSLVFHLPRVKSGHSTGALPLAIDCSERGVMTLIATES